MSGNAITLMAALIIGSLLFSASARSATVSQVPLILGSGGDVPGNLALVLATDRETLVTPAHPDHYRSNTTYGGYFDPHKCYTYDREKEWFEPKSTTSNRQCQGNYQWSGNFLNWAGTPAIDLFRSVLTGGDRVVDQKNLTVLSKSRNPESREGMRRSMVPRNEITGAAPVSSQWEDLHVSLLDPPYTVTKGSNTYLYISSDGSELFDYPWHYRSRGYVDYDERVTDWWTGGRLKNQVFCPRCFARYSKVFRVRMRVKVCVSGLLESNCKAYPGGGYKPEGLVQKHSDMLRYSVFGYLNDSYVKHDGGVLRAAQKFVGDKRITPGIGEEDNPAREWDSQTGILFRNPDSVRFTMGDVHISDSGVINYINKSGQLNDHVYKTSGPISELYYAATRYFRNIGGVYDYSRPHDASALARKEWADDFPVIAQWQDPIQYACQKNAILGIAAAGSWNDKNLPGSTSAVGEPDKPKEVIADRKIDVVSATQAIFDLEGITTSASASQFTVNNNSAYIAGLAYLANTRDMRPDLPGKQSISTFWVDVQEGGKVRPRRENQYWLAAKYGGFKVPEERAKKTYAFGSALPEAWWHTSGDKLSSGDIRPDNFFVAGEAMKMAEALDRAFMRVVQNRQVTTSQAVTSTRLKQERAVFQASFDSTYWSGDVVAREVGPAGSVKPTPIWSASARLGSKSPGARKIFTPRPLDRYRSDTATTQTRAVDFTWEALTDAQKVQLMDAGDGPDVKDERARQRLDYLRGDRSRERPAKADARDAGKFRHRASRLGDIVNSAPQYVANQNFGYARLPGDTWKAAREAYADYRVSKAGRTPMVVVGANDGMLHGFDASLTASGGEELFAFIPNGVFANLKLLTAPDYAHRYYVDGTPRVSDAWVAGRWRTLVAGTTGAGGRSVFALDISEPGQMGSDKFLWEFTHPNMGFTIGQPAIVALANGKFSVVVTSGYASRSTNKATVWFLDAATGEVIKSMPLASSGELGAPLLADTTGDGVADRLYMADTAGNLWQTSAAVLQPAGRRPISCSVPPVAGGHSRSPRHSRRRSTSEVNIWCCSAPVLICSSVTTNSPFPLRCRVCTDLSTREEPWHAATCRSRKYCWRTKVVPCGVAPCPGTHWAAGRAGTWIWPGNLRKAAAGPRGSAW